MVQAWPSPALIRNQAKQMSLSSDQVRPGPINLRHWPGLQNGYMFSPSTTQVPKLKAPGTLVKLVDRLSPDPGYDNRDTLDTATQPLLSWLDAEQYSRLDVEQDATLAQGRVVGSEGVLTA